MSPTFADLGVPADLVAVLSERGIIDPFPIQAATIPDALDGRDICGRAPTGSGKTIAFGVPLAAALDGRSNRGPEALVLVPTRELCAQVAGELAPLLAARKGSVVAVYGGVSDRPQRRALQRGASVVVACPGRLEDLLGQGALRLDSVRHVVIDEADRMADMGFMPAVKRLLDLTAEDRQTQLFSATLGGPVAELTKRYQHDAARHEIESDDEGIAVVDHEWRSVARAERAAITAQLVDTIGPTVVFSRTRHGASRLARQLSTLGVSAAEMHGGRTQSQRDKALAGFASGRTQALVATDVAARGIHVDDVACVVHFDLPGDADTYIHRSGRTGRAGASGSVVVLVDETAAKEAAALRRALGLESKPKSGERRERDHRGSARQGGGHDSAGSSPRRRARTSPSADERAERSTSPNQRRKVRTSEPRADIDLTARPAQRPEARTSTAARPELGGRPARRERGSSDSGRANERTNGSTHRKGGGRTSSGQVKFFDARKGYGFIERERGDDLFVHWSNIAGGEGYRSLEEGQQVEFEVGPGRKGEEALGVRAV